MSRRVLTIVAAVVSGAVALYALIGYLLLPFVLRSILEDRLSARLDRPVRIEALKIDPFRLTVEGTGMSVAGERADEPLLAVRRLYADLQLASLVAGGPVVAELRIEGPSAHLVRHEDGRINYAALLAPDARAAPQPDPRQEAAGPWRFSVSNILLTGGHLVLTDERADTRHAVRDLALAIPFISNLPEHVDAHVLPMFHAVVNETPVTLAGHTLPFTEARSTAIGLDLHDLDLQAYLPYLPIDLHDGSVTGTLSGQLSIAFRQDRSLPPRLEISGRVRLAEAAIRRAVRSGRDGGGREAQGGAQREAQMVPFVSLPHVELKFQQADVFADILRLHELRVEHPELHIVRRPSGEVALPFRAALSAAMAPDAEAAGEETPTRRLTVTLDEASVSDGRIVVRDESVSPPFETTLAPISLTVRGAGTRPGETAEVEASLRTEAGERVHHHGRMTLSPLTLDGTIAVERLLLQRYASYVRQWSPADLSGRADLAATVRYTGSRGLEKLSEVRVSVTGLTLRAPQVRQPLARIPALTVRGGDVDLLGRRARIVTFTSRDGEILVRRETDGALTGAALLPDAPAAPAAGPRWQLEASKVALSRYRAVIEDRRGTRPVTTVLAPLSLTLEQLSTRPGARAKVSFEAQTDDQTLIQLTGTAGLEPVAAELDVRVDGLKLRRFEPYWASETVLQLDSGALFAAGHLTVAAPTGEKRREGPLAVRFTGETSLTNLSARSKETGQDVLRWNSLYAGALSATTSPTRLQVDQVALADFYMRVEVQEDGTLNLQHLWGTDARGQAEEARSGSDGEAGAAPAKAGLQAVVQQIALQNGRIDFLDHYIADRYHARLTEMTGRVSDFRLDGEKPAEVDLRGKLNDRAPVEVTGEIVPAAGSDLFVNLTLQSTGIQLPPLTPYAEKYAGYTIEQGELSMHLRYLIDERRVQGQNALVLNQFQLGRQVEGGTDLPVRLAVSLLKDREGRIQLDIPVQGALDDPQFSIWGMVGQVLKNLVTKAVTSPFQLIGALFGGANAEEVRYAEFGYGRADLERRAQEKLETLAKALAEHPGFQLEIVPRVDPAKDREALRWERFTLKLQAQKAEELRRQGRDVTAEQVTIEPEEYERYLRKAYQAETFPKPRTFLGLPKRLDVPEIEKLILTHIQITEEDLQELAGRRARQVKSFLVQEQVAPERLVLADADRKTPQSEQAELPPSRVDFVIQPES